MRTALVLIDRINDLIHPEGAIPTCAAELERRPGRGSAGGIEQLSRLARLVRSADRAQLVDPAAPC